MTASDPQAGAGGAGTPNLLRSRTAAVLGCSTFGGRRARASALTHQEGP